MLSLFQQGISDKFSSNAFKENKTSTKINLNALWLKWLFSLPLTEVILRKFRIQFQTAVEEILLLK